jgi:hypothetical protein
MQHADISSIRRFQPVAVKTLVRPDGLQQFFWRRGTVVAQAVDGAAALAPDGVEIFRAGVHRAVFCAAGLESIYFERNHRRFCLFKVGVGEIFVRREGNFPARMAKVLFGFMQ